MKVATEFKKQSNIFSVKKSLLINHGSQHPQMTIFTCDSQRW